MSPFIAALLSVPVLLLWLGPLALLMWMLLFARVSSRRRQLHQLALLPRPRHAP